MPTTARLPNPLNIISVATAALITGIALRVAQGRRVPVVVGGIALMPTSFLAFNPPMLVVAIAWASLGTVILSFITVGRRGTLRLLTWLVMAMPWAVLLNLYWLIPFAGVYTGGGAPESNATFTDPTNWSWATINNTIPNILTLVANWAWYLSQYLPFASDLDQPSWIWVRYVLPTLPREKIIVQTKIAPFATADEFRRTFDQSMKYLRLDHVDLLSIHGINNRQHLEWSLRKGGCLEAARKLQSEGRALRATGDGPDARMGQCDSPC